MGIMDKIQGAAEKVTGDDTRLNAAEIVAIQQCYNALQLGYLKSEFFIDHVQNNDVKLALKEVRDEFIKAHIEKPRRILEKAGVPFLNLNVDTRIQNKPANVGQILRDEEVLLDSVLALQATITGLQAGALVAVRGDVREYFLNARDAAMDQWKKLGMVVVKNAPQMLPPTYGPGAGTTTTVGNR
jgi:hypothetical protein